MTIKEKLLSAFGAAGTVLWWVVSFLFVIIPIAATGLPIWARVIIFAVIMLTDVIGTILTITVYIWGTIAVLSSPLSFFTIIFFIDLILYVIFLLIPTICKLLSLLTKDRHSDY